MTSIDFMLDSSVILIASSIVFVLYFERVTSWLKARLFLQLLGLQPARGKNLDVLATELGLERLQVERRFWFMRWSSPESDRELRERCLKIVRGAW